MFEVRGAAFPAQVPAPVALKYCEILELNEFTFGPAGSPCSRSNSFGIKLKLRLLLPFSRTDRRPIDRPAGVKTCAGRSGDIDSKRISDRNTWDSKPEQGRGPWVFRPLSLWYLPRNSSAEKDFCRLRLRPLPLPARSPICRPPALPPPPVC